MPEKQKKRTREPQEVRKASLIQAAIEVIAEHGLSNVTSQKVASTANMTAAMVNFHFSGKTALLNETLRFVADEFIEAHQQALLNCGDDPQEQLTSLIETSLSETLSDFRKVSVWYAFYSESRSREDYIKICAEHNKAYHNAYFEPIKKLCEREDHVMDADALTLGLIGIIEHACQTILVQKDFNKTESIKSCLAFLKSVFRTWK